MKTATGTSDTNISAHSLSDCHINPLMSIVAIWVEHPVYCYIGTASYARLG